MKTTFKGIGISLSGFGYRLLRPILFLTDSEKIHERLLLLGQAFGRSRIVRKVLGVFWRVEDPALAQSVAGINFPNPIGLAAGFDYEARLTQILPSAGFGFETIGTITNKPYEGNPPPRLGRLVKSQSLLVNKGFKNRGVDDFIEQHKSSKFVIPVGLSIGKTNSHEPMTQAEAVADVVSAFKKAEASDVSLSYYELNISCPNLYGNVEFYSPAHLEEVLAAVTELKLKKPLFIKMPISESDEVVSGMLDVIVRFPVAGVVLGNLQKDRNHPLLVKEEMGNMGKGNFSGKPTWERSNELIELAYRHARGKLVIVGCGGVFSAKDAYTKIRLGASLVELITGLIFKGPQLAGEINLGLIGLLKRDGFSHISEAVGADVRDR